MLRYPILAAFCLIWLSGSHAFAQPITADADCKSVQGALKSKGYSIAVDGQCGRKTSEAIAAYQADAGLGVTGRLTKDQAGELIGMPVTSSTVVVATVDEHYQQLIGTWKGTYYCAEVEAGATLTFRQDNPNKALLKGEFKFYPTSRSPSSVKTGSYDFYAQPSGDDAITIKPLNWIVRPAGYRFFSTTISPSTDGTEASGTVNHRTCGRIQLSRVGNPIAYGTTSMAEAVPPAADTSADNVLMQGATAAAGANAAGDCAEIQQALTALGYRPGSDGRCDKATNIAIKAYQKFLGVKPTGTLDIGYRKALLQRAATAEPKVETSSAPTVQQVETQTPVTSDADAIDCSMLSGPAKSDCGTANAWAKNFAFNADTARSAAARICRDMLESSLTELVVIRCVAAAYVLRSDVTKQWEGIGGLVARSTSCQAALTELSAIGREAAAGTGNARTWTTTHGRCMSVIQIAENRGARPSWAECVVGTEPAAFVADCDPDPAVREALQLGWRQGLADCETGAVPTGALAALTDLATTSGRQAASITCEQVVLKLLADGELTPATAQRARARIGVAEAAAAERKRVAEEEKRRVEIARRKAETEAIQREAEASIARARAEAEEAEKEQAARAGLLAGLLGSSEYEGTARAIEAGDPFEFDDVSLLFTGGVAAALTNCPNRLDAGQALELGSFVLSATMQAGGGNQYNAPDISDMMTDAAGAQAIFAAGAYSAKAMGCSEPATTELLANILEVVRSNKRGANGTQATFIATCTPVHGEASCMCVAEAGRASYPNLYQLPYSRELLYDIMQRNPMAALVMLGCGIQRY
ncbi:hypothetical protein VW23_015120 [Devosia insulae DS-56]|uniref:Peptidoglycan binding-like domain-containing protein n=1 Tax=Devosia insulae DS-56 TaxID=1116389 RepID=A0A1E5XSW6_9HYPH|nr:peptidoglycan-binding domain-containing protein [Devosia insulae]OEO31663.1 hypothetical protein VW23_015120 [Devosia insulae DS-56]